jgi:hypothetical protein
MVGPAPISHITDLNHYRLIDLPASLRKLFLELLPHFLYSLRRFPLGLVLKLLQNFLFLRLARLDSLINVNIDIINVLVGDFEGFLIVSLG